MHGFWGILTWIEYLFCNRRWSPDPTLGWNVALIGLGGIMPQLYLCLRSVSSSRSLKMDKVQR